MYYTRLSLTCDPAFSEILMAEVAEAGFDTFLETDHGFEAYAENEGFDSDQLRHIQEKYSAVNPLILAFDKIEKKNWNEEWEKNLEMITVGDQCLIRAEFHKPEHNYPYEIIITPKMSFGTGHHQTTWLMISNQLEMDHKGKRVMDAGCGTAILSIMASMKGAKEVEAFDIDEWSVINGKENAENNHCTNIHLQLGKINQVKLTGEFEIILANINKNILLQEIGIYSQYLASPGQLLISGFYTHDTADLVLEASKYGLVQEKQSEKETWASILFRKG